MKYEQEGSHNDKLALGCYLSLSSTKALDWHPHPYPQYDDFCPQNYRQSSS